MVWLVLRRGALALAVAAALPCAFASAAVLAGGELHSVVVRPDGTVWSWGSGLYGQAGDGALRSRYETVGRAWAKNLFDVTAVAAGSNHTLALRSDGTVWAWGDNLWGELGDGSRTLRTVPARVAGLDHIVGIAAGYIHSMALGADGSVWAWGDNHYGQLGSGTTTESLRPLRLQGVSNVSAIAAGFYHSAAVVRTGRVLMWGQNTHGQLGDAVLRLRLVPVEVSAVRDVVAVAAGQFHTLVLVRGGTVWTWGGNAFGQLGRRSSVMSSVDRQMMTPFQPPGFKRPDSLPSPTAAADEPAAAAVERLQNVTMIAAGEDHSAALTSDGQVWTWGDNLYGQLDDGTWEPRSRPVKAVGVSSVVAIASGYSHMLALQSDGTVWTWGFGFYGQLGDNLVTRRVGQARAVAAVSLAPLPRFEGPSFHPLGQAETSWIDPVVKVDNGVFTVRGQAATPTAYVIMTRPSRAGPGTPNKVLMATGALIGGCVTVGVQRQNQWVHYDNVDVPGPFTIIWQPPTTGEYTVVVAHCLPTGRRDNDFRITHLGWFDAPADRVR
ncbi:MAG: hypothetical protein DMF98_00980 [Acidobacteria bacterium]|nr:MAG: hypothetical protein DMF98_00980 [Acidobacteriota bacterium]